MIKTALCFVIAGLFCAQLTAGELTIVPFAIPVAVPVAVVQQPTLFYGVARSAPPATLPQPASAPAATLVDTTTLRGQVDALLVKRCAECHRADRADGDLALFDADGKPLEKLPRQLIVDATAPRPDGAAVMPPGSREKLTMREWEMLNQWARMPKSFVY